MTLQSKTFYGRESTKILLPPLAEQKRIVAILDEAFEGIATATAHAERNLHNARELFQSVLQSTFEQKGEDWVELVDLTEHITDGDHQPPPKVAEGLPFITISNIDKATNTIDFTNTFKVSTEYVANLKPHRKPKLGDVLYTVTGSFGIPVLVDFEKEFCFQRHIGLIRPNRETDSRWLFYAVQTKSAQSQAEAGATGTAQKTVSLKVLRGLKIPSMPLATQKNIVKKLDALAAETRRLEAVYQRKLDALSELKQSLLQRAFSGKL